MGDALGGGWRTGPIKGGLCCVTVGLGFFQKIFGWSFGLLVDWSIAPERPDGPAQKTPMVRVHTMDGRAENVYNRRQRRSEPQLKRWRYAGLMLTYRCPARCAFCYDHCGPDAGGLLEIDVALEAWQSLVRLAGDNARIHITGGEPFVVYDHMITLLARARAEGLPGLEEVETNGFWAESEADIRRRLRELDDVGLGRLKISCDPFHAEFVDPERVRLLARMAREVLGPHRVRIRWERYLQLDVNSLPMPSDRAGWRRIYVETCEQGPCRFTGRAAEVVALLVARVPVADLRDENCRRDLLGAKGVHVDPHGYVFSGVCSGIVLGRVQDEPLDALWTRFDPPRTELLGELFEAGPTRLLDRAVAEGYQPEPRYADKCHLCTSVRRFFFDRQRYRTIIGPCDCYGYHVPVRREVGSVEGRHDQL